MTRKQELLRMVWKSRLPRQEMMLLAAYVQLTDPDSGEMPMHRSLVAKTAGLTLQQVYFLRRQLEARGLVREVRKNSWGAEIYKVDAAALEEQTRPAQNQKNEPEKQPEK